MGNHGISYTLFFEFDHAPCLGRKIGKVTMGLGPHYPLDESISTVNSESCIRKMTPLLSQL